MTKKARVSKISDLSSAIRSFLGYLEGTSKAQHTIKNYRLDLLSFQRFLQEETHGQASASEHVTSDDLERYHLQLRSQGLKNNTRRRKLLTIQKFLTYLANRKKIPGETAKQFPTPHKIERIPSIVPLDELLAKIRSLPTETLLDSRNRCMLWTMAETGCLVSEVTHLRYENWKRESGGQAALATNAVMQGAGAPARFSVMIEGKSPRKLQVSSELYLAIEELQKKSSEQENNRSWLFTGFNKFGSMGSPITARGVEILVKHHASRLGFPELTPRTFRHSAVIHWLENGSTQQEIQQRLGLKTGYAFRVYQVMIRSRARENATL